MKKFPLFGLAAFVTILGIFVITYSINLEEAGIQNQGNSVNIKRAVIIDQLHNDKPNEDYHKNVTSYLEAAGYKVDLFTTDEITVNFYKRLPSMNYEFIVLRSHALGFGTVEESASLFTGEKYTEDKYLNEQFAGQVGRGVPYLPEQVEQRGGLEALANETYFVVGSRLVNDLMMGSFPKSVIILGGCETVEGKFLADSLLQRGASEIIGWNGLVSSGDNDKVIMELLEQTLVNEMEIKDAVSFVTEKYDNKLRTPAKLEYYSSGAVGSSG